MSLKEIFGRGKGDSRHLDKLVRLLEINKALAAQTNLRALLESIVDAAIELTGAERGFVIVEETGEVRIKCARNADREDLRRPAGKISKSVVQRVLETREGLRVDDAGEAEGLSTAGSVMDLRLRSLLAVPLVSVQGVLGCLYVDNRFARGSFSQADQEVLEAFADQAALALMNAELREEASRAQERLKARYEDLRRELTSRDAEITRMRAHFDPPPEREDLRHPYDHFLGQSEPLRRALHLLDCVMEGEYPVLLTGESGTGKELAAVALHLYGSRSAGPFVAINCAAIPDNLVESELFGHVRGAFTGAEADREGSFQLARGGILFLDEIGDLPLPMQATLLRVLQERSCRRVGGTQDEAVDVRIVAATNRRLEEALREGHFRTDLFYRIRVFEIPLPALRDRIEDIEMLAGHFYQEAGGGTLVLEEKAREALVSHPWPGNIRELRNEMTRLAALRQDQPVRHADLHLGDATWGADERGRTGAQGRREEVARSLQGLTLEQIEEMVIRATLERVGGRKVEAARILGIPRRTFYNRLRKYGLV